MLVLLYVILSFTKKCGGSVFPFLGFYVLYMGFNNDPVLLYCKQKEEC